MTEGGASGDGDDFLGKFVFVPEIVFECGPDNLGDTRLMSENEGIVVVGGFECSEAEGLRDGTHDKNIREGIDVT